MVQKNLVDLEAAQYINGSRFVIYKGIGAKLIRALQ
jgi:seryl-tRNA synthetase